MSFPVWATENNGQREINFSEAPQTTNPSHPSTDDSEDERMSPNQ